VSTCIVTYDFRHPLVSHPIKTNVCTSLQNKNDILESERQLTVLYGMGGIVNSTPCKLVF
jgi:hypothetical protein